MDRLVVFADRRIGFAMRLARAAIEAARRSPDVEVVALVDATGRGAPSELMVAARRIGIGLLGRLAGGRGPGAGESLKRLARRHGVPLVVPPRHDVNDERVAEHLARRLGATLALSVGCLAIFRSPLLSTFDVVVNYHDGALPHYRGLGATAWSIYRGEQQSGFTFHRMVERIDAGAILVQGAVPIAPDATGAQVSRLKTQAAAAAMPVVLAKMVARDPGTEQPAGGRYFSGRDRRALITIEDPAAVDWPDLQQRLRAFGRLVMTLDGRRWDVTALERIEDGRPRPLAFVTRDGVAAMPVRFSDLPRWLYLATRPFAGRSR
ncbi:MAG TPA: formyltransferase family protein [Vicinamibacterales bacterium]|nr:formyltransferase family protein [Vicinamibacterales bacterium]